MRPFHSWRRRLNHWRHHTSYNIYTQRPMISVLYAPREIWSNNDQLIILRWSSLKQACLIHGPKPIKAAEASEQSQRDNKDALPELSMASHYITINIHIHIHHPLILDSDYALRASSTSYILLSAKLLSCYESRLVIQAISLFPLCIYYFLRTHVYTASMSISCACNVCC